MDRSPEVPASELEYRAALEAEAAAQRYLDEALERRHTPAIVRARRRRDDAAIERRIAEVKMHADRMSLHTVGSAR